jgi:hypothetical protein
MGVIRDDYQLAAAQGCEHFVNRIKLNVHPIGFGFAQS